jgi:preprotein translocase subunit SecG
MWILILQILHAVVCVILIAVVLLQSGKQAGLSGTIAGGAETFFGKNKGRTIDAMLEKWTSVVAFLFLGLSIALFLVLKFANLE